MNNLNKTQQKILVVGATGGTGLAIVNKLLKAGHKVTAFSRHADNISITSDSLRTINGDVTNQQHVDDAVKGQDAVIVALGITENPFKVRLFGPSRTPVNVRSKGTRNVIEAMSKNKVSRLLVQSSYGVGPSRDRLRSLDKLFFKLLLKPQIEDTERQEQEVHRSLLDWTLIQPVHLTDHEGDPRPYASSAGNVKKWAVSRQSVARFITEAAAAPEFIGKTVALSGIGA